jgi:hypothetical protein
MERHKNYRLYFINYKKRGDHVEYIMRLNCIEDSKLFAEFAERYSTLKDLHDVMKKEASSINFPKFPPKKFFGNTDEKFLNKRQTDLQHYFNAILGSKEFSQLPGLKAWILRVLEKHVIKVQNNTDELVVGSSKEILNNVDNSTTTVVKQPSNNHNEVKKRTFPKPNEEGKI